MSHVKIVFFTHVFRLPSKSSRNRFWSGAQLAVNAPLVLISVTVARKRWMRGREAEVSGTKLTGKKGP